MSTKYTCPNSRMMLPAYRKLGKYSAHLGRLATCPACLQTIPVRLLSASDRVPKGNYYTDHTVDEIA